MKRLLLLLVIVPTFLVAAAAVAASSTAVSITSSGFRPISVTVAAGDNVTWTNNDAVRHQVVANNGSFSSPVLSAKQSFSHTFRTGGTFGYHDGLHPALKASITVVPQRTVWILKDGFLPSTIVVRTGQAVRWVNKTTANQQVVADDTSFASRVLARGGTFSHTFATAGTFGYHDGLQPALKGSVVVLAPTPAETLSLTSNRTVTTYGSAVLLSGTVTNGTAGEKVTVTPHPQGLKTTQSAQTVTTSADGSFSVTVVPLIHTVYVATTAKAASEPLAVNVRPRMRLGHVGRTRGVVAVTAARSFRHKFVLLQAFRPRTGVWVNLRRVRLTVAIAGTAPTVRTKAIFRLRVRHGLRVRVRMPLSQTLPGYVSGASNAIRS
jgi:plastocyanin